MRCQEIAGELDAYLAKELDGDAVAMVEAHLRECANCRAELQMLRKENAVYKEYASMIDASGNTVGLDIPSTAALSRIAGPWWRWAAAAGVLLAIVLSWHFYKGKSDRGADVVQTPETSASISVAQAASSYEEALSLLHSAYEGKRGRLDPELVTDVDRNLEITRSAVEECKQALREHPDDRRVVALLLHDYEMQIGILKQITEAL